MAPSVIESARQYLYLLTQGFGDPGRDEEELVRLLDVLALARHGTTAPETRAKLPEPPTCSYDDRRAFASERFPRLGLYNVALPVVMAPEGRVHLGVGDAVDDVVDIAGDLSEVVWLFENVSVHDALWGFCRSYDTHWGEHLRCLQLFLHELSSHDRQSDLQ